MRMCERDLIIIPSLHLWPVVDPRVEYQFPYLEYKISKTNNPLIGETNIPFISDVLILIKDL